MTLSLCNVSAGVFVTYWLLLYQSSSTQMNVKQNKILICTQLRGNVLLDPSSLLTSHECHGILNHWQLSCYNESIKSPYYWPFVRGIQRSPLDSPHKGPVIWKAFVCHNIFMMTSCLPFSRCPAPGQQYFNDANGVQQSADGRKITLGPFPVFGVGDGNNVYFHCLLQVCLRGDEPTCTPVSDVTKDECSIMVTSSCERPSIPR